MVVTLFGILWSGVNHLWPNAMWQFSKAIHRDKNTTMSTALVCSCRRGLSVKVHFWAQANIKIKQTWKWRQDDKTVFLVFHIGCWIGMLDTSNPSNIRSCHCPQSFRRHQRTQHVHRGIKVYMRFLWKATFFQEVRWMKSCWFPSWQGAVTVQCSFVKVQYKLTRSRVASSFRTTEFWKKQWEVAERLAMKPSIRCERRFSIRFQSPFFSHDFDFAMIWHRPSGREKQHNFSHTKRGCWGQKPCFSSADSIGQSGRNSTAVSWLAAFPRTGIPPRDDLCSGAEVEVEVKFSNVFIRKRLPDLVWSFVLRSWMVALHPCRQSMHRCFAIIPRHNSWRGGAIRCLVKVGCVFLHVWKFSRYWRREERMLFNTTKMEKGSGSHCWAQLGNRSRWSNIEWCGKQSEVACWDSMIETHLQGKVDRHDKYDLTV